MKIGTTKERLLRAVQLTERIVGKKESLPVLSCLLLETIEHGLMVRATNLEAGIEVMCPAEVLGSGTVAVPVSTFSQTIRTLQGDKVTLSIIESNLIIESKGSKTLIKTVPHDEFPILPIQSDTEKISTPRKKLLEGLQSVMYAASPSMIRPELGSVFVSIHNEKIICAATDSFRLAEKKISNQNGLYKEDVLIPLKHAIELTHILELLTNDNIDVYIDEAQMIVVGEGTKFISRIIDGSFPNYTEIIPKTFSTEATLLKNDFSEVLRKARVFSGIEQNIAFHIYPNKKIFSATARSSDVGEMSDTVEAALSGEDVDISFHINYLNDCLQAIKTDSIVLGFLGAYKPLVIKGVGDEGFTYLAMPLNK
ncbi:DNA polymerase III subunit beta [Candidatus Kaiserbacteria bacterium]|nr:DNA polymerase III subunit beta [Candidatus Kaiserbacteria bacterium]